MHAVDMFNNDSKSSYGNIITYILVFRPSIEFYDMFSKHSMTFVSNSSLLAISKSCR
jgi:hypothetical protein